MKTRLLLLAFLLVGRVVPAQVNIADTFRAILGTGIPDSAIIDKLNERILQYVTSYPEQVLVYTDSAITLSEKAGDSVRLAFSYNRKGVAFYYLGDYSSSLDNYFAALAIKEKIGDKNSLWREYNNIGLVLRNMEQNADALKYFKLSLALLSQSANESYEAICWNNIGISYRGLKQLDSARFALEKALVINTRLGATQNLAHNFNNLANVYKQQKDRERAEEFYQKALVLNTKLGNSYEQAQNLNNLADLYLSQKEFGKTKINLDKAYVIINKIRADQMKTDYLYIKANYFAGIRAYESCANTWRDYSKLRDSMFTANRSKQFNQLKVLADAEKEVQKVQFLERINEIQKERIRIQHIIEIGGGVAFLVILVLLIIVVFNLRTNKKLTFSLKERSEELQTLNEELQSTNEELLTQREELEQTLNSLKDTQTQLIQSEKMTSLGILAAGVAHEINNPLNYIHGGITGLRDYFRNPKEHESHVDFYIHAVEEGLEKATSIVSGLNQFSRSEDIVNENVDIHWIIDTCLLMLENRTRDRIQVKTSYTRERFRMVGNDGKLHQAVLNILMNAVQAIDGKGEITISSTLDTNYVQLSFSDSGCGISEENLSRIFDPFFTTKDPGEGTGLGMSITYNIIQEFKGSIEIRSSEGKGTTVLVKLPVVSSQ